MPFAPGSSSPPSQSASRSVWSAGDDKSWWRFAALLLFGAALDVVCRYFPADLPFVAPWEFSWPVFLVTALTLAWFFRGLACLAPSERPARWRSAAFLLGVVGNYIVLQTHIDYFAQHMFFVHRWAHFWLHHSGAMLIAFGMSGPVLRAGMPEFLRPLIDARPLRRVLDFLQDKWIAPFLFVGLLYFWLIPDLHTRVMLDRRLYDVMNWSMAINGIMFWSLVMDPRPHPPARLSVLWRALAIIIIELPQMVLGAVLSLSETDFYPVYNICGRVIAMTALTDQHLGGLIIWLPGTLTSFMAMICVLVAMRMNEEKANSE